MIKKPDDYYLNLNISCNIKEDNDSIIKNYLINDSKCKGKSEHLFLNNNAIEVVLNDLHFTKNVEYEYKLNYINYEILYCIEGMLTCGNSNDNSFCAAQAGDIKFIKNDSTTRWEKFDKSKKWKSISICFNQDLILQFYKQNSETKEISFIDIDKQIDNIMSDITQPEIKVAFYQIFTHSRYLNSLCRNIYIQSKALEIISLLLQYKNYNSSSNQSKSKYTLYNDDICKINQVRYLLEKNYVKPLTISQLSNIVGISTSKLKAGFKNYCGITIYGYVRDIRMQKAYKYLLDGNMNVIEAANLVGYSNPSHFSSAFKKIFGINPSNISNKLEKKI